METRSATLPVLVEDSFPFELCLRLRAHLGVWWKATAAGAAAVARRLVAMRMGRIDAVYFDIFGCTAACDVFHLLR